MFSRAGASPVITAARVGEQTGAAAYASVNRTPWRARASTFGVWSFTFPWQCRSDQPMSSVMISRTFGGGGDPDASTSTDEPNRATRDRIALALFQPCRTPPPPENCRDRTSQTNRVGPPDRHDAIQENPESSQHLPDRSSRESARLLHEKETVTGRPSFHSSSGPVSDGTADRSPP